MSQNATAEILVEALNHHQSGRLNDAEKLYRKILSIDPHHADSFHLLGLIAHQVGKNDIGIELINQAIQYRNTVPTYYYNLGCIHKSLNHLDDAKTSFEQALALKPDYAEVILNLGNISLDIGMLDDAKSRFEKVISINPNFAEAHNNLGNVFLKQRKMDEALVCYQRACSLAPHFAMAFNNYGNALMKKERFDEAIHNLQRASELNPNYAEPRFNLGLTYYLVGKPLEAFNSLRAAVRLDPGNSMAWTHMSTSIQKLRFSTVDPMLIADLENMLDQRSIRIDNIVLPVLSALRCVPDLSSILDQPLKSQLSFEIASEKLTSYPLFTKLLQLVPISDAEIERLLTFVRRELIMAIDKGLETSKNLPFFVALATQCFINEYVYSETAEENEAVERLEDNIKIRLNNDHDIPATWLACLASYCPLYRFEWAEKLASKTWPDELAPLIAQQILEPLEEKRIRGSIPCLTGTTDAISQAVRNQYEENPYPRWIRKELLSKTWAFRDFLYDLFPDEDFDDYAFQENTDILIAGCGTGRQSLDAALTYSGARILSVDLSLSSLAYAIRKTRELGVTSIEYAQGDILELGSIDRKFDYVECGGVLHHLRDPMAGWRVLVDLMRPRAFMKIGLYSEIARRAIVKMRGLIAEKGYRASPSDIRLCREYIMSNSREEDFKTILGSTDFYSLSNCRDLLFHVQEHRFTLPQIERCLEELGLQFLGFGFKDDITLMEFKKSYPNAEDMKNLSCWHEFEETSPFTFASMYQFWCRKKD